MFANSSVSDDSFIPASPSIPAGPSAPANIWVLTNVPAPTSPPAPASLICSPHTSLPVVQNRTKPFFIGKFVIATDNKIVPIYTKGIK